MPNFVTVTAVGVNSDSSNIQFGEVCFTPSDIVWATGYGLIGAVPAVLFTFNGGVSTLSVSLYAMDNAGVSTNWSWIVTGNLEGIPIMRRSISVLFATGPTQNLATLLNAGVLVP
jgi:hypothetical protein